MFAAFRQVSVPLRRQSNLVASLCAAPTSSVVAPTSSWKTGDINLAASSQQPFTIQQQQVRWRSNRSRRGLYNGKDISTGNKVSFSMRATKRKFKPNVFMKRVYSEILDDMLRFHLTASTLRSIDKAGGLDNYLLDPKREFTEGEGFFAKRKILKRLKNQARMDRKKAEQEGQALPETATTADASAATNMETS